MSLAPKRSTDEVVAAHRRWLERNHPEKIKRHGSGERLGTILWPVVPYEMVAKQTNDYEARDAFFKQRAENAGAEWAKLCQPRGTPIYDQAMVLLSRRNNP